MNPCLWPNESCRMMGKTNLICCAMVPTAVKFAKDYYDSFRRKINEVC
jgi:hypothetical protein